MTEDRDDDQPAHEEQPPVPPSPPFILRSGMNTRAATTPADDRVRGNQARRHWFGRRR
jgi:hypothetical protein